MGIVKNSGCSHLRKGIFDVGLKQDDKNDDNRVEYISENPGTTNQVKQIGKIEKYGDEQKTTDNLDCASPPQHQKNSVYNKGENSDVEDILPTRIQ